MRGNVRIPRNSEARSRNHCCCGKRLSTTYSECVLVALVNQQAKRMRRIILSFVDYWLYRGLPHCVKRDDFPWGGLFNVKTVIFSTPFKVYNYQTTQPFIVNCAFTATCFDSTESSPCKLRTILK
jgi:hypothetical protein